MSIEQQVSTSSHGGMCPVVSAEGSSYVKYSDHLQAMEELRQEAPRWHLKPVELWPRCWPPKARSNRYGTRFHT